jgi:hypothetical protein
MTKHLLYISNCRCQLLFISLLGGFLCHLARIHQLCSEPHYIHSFQQGIQSGIQKEAYMSACAIWEEQGGATTCHLYVTPNEVYDDLILGLRNMQIYRVNFNRTNIISVPIHLTVFPMCNLIIDLY